jgi:phosphoribosylaminoimidazole carboxylase/phosphoribosylaminoimidazole-succinocarboxamide synthase
VFGVRTDPSLVFVRSKDRITAGDGAKSHEMRGKAVLSTQTNCALFEFLQSVGIPTHFVGRVGGASHPDADRSFVAKKCAMIPIEWVARYDVIPSRVTCFLCVSLQTSGDRKLPQETRERQRG